MISDVKFVISEVTNRWVTHRQNQTKLFGQHHYNEKASKFLNGFLIFFRTKPREKYRVSHPIQGMMKKFSPKILLNILNQTGRLGMQCCDDVNHTQFSEKNNEWILWIQFVPNFLF